MERERSFGVGKSLLFAALICIVCSVLVSVSFVLLRSRHASNQKLERERRILVVAGLLGHAGKPNPQLVQQLFADHIRLRRVDLETGTYAAEDAPISDENTRPAPPNAAGVIDVPRVGAVYQVLTDGKPARVIIPIEGKGLWSTLKGYLALDVDGRTVQGITFYEHAETPGLGGEVDNVRWQALWSGRLALDENGAPRLRVIKGQAGPPAEDPYRVDGLSGATLTCDGVNNMLDFWLGSNGYGPYLKRLRERGAEG